jgi:predicted metal-binding membrane protein
MEAPFEAVAVMVPSAAPLQLTLVELAETVTVIGSLIVTVVVAVQLPLLFPLAAVATIVYIPGAYVAEAL